MSGLDEGDIVRCIKPWGPLVVGRLYFVRGIFLNQPCLHIDDAERGAYSCNLGDRSAVELIHAANR